MWDPACWNQTRAWSSTGNYSMPDVTYIPATSPMTLLCKEPNLTTSGGESCSHPRSGGGSIYLHVRFQWKLLDSLEDWFPYRSTSPSLPDSSHFGVGEDETG